MIFAVELPDISCGMAGRLFEWIEQRAEKLRPWLETFAAMTAAREGEELPEGAVPVIFARVLEALGAVMAWPDMDAGTKAAARTYFAEHRHGD